MDSVRVQLGQTELIKNDRFVDSVRAGVTGLSAKVVIYRNSTPRFWNGSGYGASPTNLVMTEMDSINLPGEYVYSFSTTGASEEEHFVIAKSGSTLDARVVNDMQSGSVYVGGPEMNYLRSRKRKLEYSSTFSFEILYAADGVTPERKWAIFRDEASSLPVRDQSDPIISRGPEQPA